MARRLLASTTHRHLSPNFFDMYSFGDRSIFQIGANLGAPAAMLEMLLYARPA